MFKYIAGLLVCFGIIAGLGLVESHAGTIEGVISDGNLFSISLRGRSLPGHDIEKMWYYTNVRRVQGGLRPLYLDPEMNCRAHAWAYLMNKKYGLTHSNNRLAFYPMNFAENIAIGYSARGAVLDGWTHSSGHYKNMMNRSNRTLGVAKYRNSTIQIFRSGTRPLKAVCLYKNGLVPSPNYPYRLIPPQPVFRGYRRFSGITELPKTILNNSLLFNA